MLRFVAGANVAAGRVPWGLPVDGRVLSGSPAVEVVEGPRSRTWTRTAPSSRWSAADTGMRGSLAGLTALARRRPDLVVVELGWPGPDRLPGRTLVHTFGASAVSARALDDRLAGALEG